MKNSKSKKPANQRKTGTLIVRLDEESKSILTEAAKLRQISVSDYVRTITVPQAKKELASIKYQTIALTADEQLAFWQALQVPPKVTESQRELGRLMRGQS